MKKDNFQLALDLCAGEFADLCDSGRVWPKDLQHPDDLWVHMYEPKSPISLLVKCIVVCVLSCIFFLYTDRYLSPVAQWVVVIIAASVTGLHHTKKNSHHGAYTDIQIQDMELWQNIRSRLLRRTIFQKVVQSIDEDGGCDDTILQPCLAYIREQHRARCQSEIQRSIARIAV